jgi:hypothetical protein
MEPTRHVPIVHLLDTVIPSQASDVSREGRKECSDEYTASACHNLLYQGEIVGVFKFD